MYVYACKLMDISLVIKRVVSKDVYVVIIYTYKHAYSVHTKKYEYLYVHFSYSGRFLCQSSVS